MIIGVTGHRGRLGTELVSRGCIPVDCDITDLVKIHTDKTLHEVDMLINCASVTDVDACENKYKDDAYEVNYKGVVNLRSVFKRRIIQMSTDYIFNGVKGNYSENNRPDPINVYGMTKYLGELALLESQFPDDVIIRTTILYGGIKTDFVRNIVHKLQQEETFTIPKTLFGNPTYVPHLADAVMNICENRCIPRIIHVAGKEILSRYELALSVANIWGLDVNKIIATNDIPGAAFRPRMAGMSLKLAEKCGVPLYSVYKGLELLKNESVDNNTVL